MDTFYIKMESLEIKRQFLRGISILTVIFIHANGKLAFEGSPLLSDSKFTSELCRVECLFS